MSGALKPWEGPAVVIDGSRRYEGIVQSCGLWGASSSLPAPLQPQLAASSLHQVDVAHVRIVESGAAAASGRAAATEMEVDEPASGAKGRGGADEVRRLKEELRQAQARAQQWQALNAELQKAALQAVLS